MELSNASLDKNKDGKLQYVLLKGEEGHPDAEGRTERVKAVLEENGIILEELEMNNANWDILQAQTLMDAWIKKHENNIEFIFSNNDAMALGALKSIQKEGYNTLEAYDGVTAVEMAINEKPDLILLDVMIPKLDGISVCKKIRYALNISNIPILMISAKDTESDKIVGLEMGADDYITKPFQIREVMARIKANLRKAELNANMEINSQKNEDKDNIIKVGDLTLDLKKVEARVKGEVINLTKKEFDVLKYLASQPGQVVTREMLLRDVWEYEEYVGAIRTIDVTMNRIRDKIEKDKANPKILITKRGVGYYVTDRN